MILPDAPLKIANSGLQEFLNFDGLSLHLQASGQWIGRQRML